MAVDLGKVSMFVRDHARPLDRALFEFHFHKGPASAVITEAVTFQNEDGGFGHGIEPDLTTPNSTPLATSVGMQYLDAVGAEPDEASVRLATDFLANTFLASKTGWDIIFPEVETYPNAPWWNYESAMAGFGWGNPSAEILAYLYKFDKREDTSRPWLLARRRAIERLLELRLAGEADFHELLCFVRLHNFASEDLQREILPPLKELIVGSVNTDPNEWVGYVATPLTFVDRSDSPFASLFALETIDADLDRLEDGCAPDHWEPTWDWSGTYPQAWETARKDWIGKITVGNMLRLRTFGRV